MFADLSLKEHNLWYNVSICSGEMIFEDELIFRLNAENKLFRFNMILVDVFSGTPFNSHLSLNTIIE